MEQYPINNEHFTEQEGEQTFAPLESEEISNENKNEEVVEEETSSTTHSRWKKVSLLFLKSPWLLLQLLWKSLKWMGRALKILGKGFLNLIGFKRIDRYILGKFLSTYLFLIGIFTVIAVIFDFNENIDKLTNGGAKMREIWLDYYANFIPYLANMLSPLFVFIGVIFFTTNLASKSEIIAMKSTGMSLKRLLRPYMFSAALIAITSFWFGAYVIPHGNVARVNFENKYKKRKINIDVAENIQMQVDTGVVAYISYFDNRTKSGAGFSLDKFSEKKVISRLTNHSVRYLGRPKVFVDSTSLYDPHASRYA